MWHALWVVFAAVAIAVGLMSWSGLPVRLPDGISTRIEAALNARIDGAGVRLGRAEILIDAEGRPRLRLMNVQVLDAAGNAVAQLNQLGAALSPAALIKGRTEARVVRLSGAQITVRRDSSGAFSLDFGGAAVLTGGPTLGGVLDALDGFFYRGALAGLERIEARDLTITLEDARSGRVWQVTGGTLDLSRTDTGLTISVLSEVFNGTEDLAEVTMEFRSRREGSEAELDVEFRNAAAADIAAQSPALAVLGLLDAQISGGLSAQVDAEGRLSHFEAALEIGSGSVRTGTGAEPLAFRSARARIDVDPAAGRIRVAELRALTDLLTVDAVGHIDLVDIVGGWPERLLAQLRFSRLALAPAGFFMEPLVFDDGHADLRLTLDPITVEVGQLVLQDDEGPRRIAGTARAGPEGWEVAADLSAPSMSTAGLLRYWPPALAPGSRRWFSNNVAGGRFEGLTAALRLSPGARPVTAISAEFREATVRVMRHLPLLEGAEGRLSLVGGRFVVETTAGRMATPDGSTADFAGTTFIVPDTTVRGGPAEVRLAAAADLAPMLQLLDNRPFRLLERTARADDLLATRGTIRMRGDIGFPLRPGLQPADVSYRIDGTLGGIESARLVTGRALEAEALALSVSPEGLRIDGAATIDAVPVDAVWRQPIAPGAEGPRGLEATLTLDEATLAALGVPLPPGTLRGAAEGRLAVEFRDGAPPAFTLTSDLVGAGLRIAALRWSKGAETPGELAVTGALSEGAVSIDDLSLSAPGLDVAGTLSAADEAGRRTLRLERVRSGRWFDAPVTLSLRGAGRAPALRIDGGRIDLAALPEGGAPGGGSTPITLRLDRLQVTEGIALTDLRGEVIAGRALSGSFEALMNGGAPVRGTLVPTERGTAIRLTGANAGAVLRDSGLFQNARDGSLELVLLPTARPGEFDGRLAIGRVRMRSAQGLAALLDAVSVVGLLDELQGPGIVFETVDANFRLTPGRIVLSDAAAVGASLGISMDGVYDIASRNMDMQGVISPIYILNGIGQFLTRRGEGLFGFSYRMSGPPGATRVEVNPLSILTPGMFREIFRRPPPQVAE